MISVADDKDNFCKGVGKGYREDKNGGRGTEILTCMRELEAALLTRRQCRVSDFLVAVMANGHLVFIFTHWINLPFYYHV